MSNINTQSQKKIILGYHDKHNNNYSIIEKELPILNDEEYAPFLITSHHHFSISTKDIRSLINNFNALEAFNKVKNLVAQILIIPGLLISLLYIADLLDLTSGSTFLNGLASSRIVNFCFWIAVFGIITLWHDYYRTKSHPVSLPTIEEIDKRTMMEIQNSGIKFSKYQLIKSIYYLNEDSQRLLVGFSSAKGLNTYELFTTLLSDPAIGDILNRADIDLSREQLQELQITQETLPIYHFTSVRTFVTYALEDALLTRSRTIHPAHFMIALFRIFPVLQQYLRLKESSVEILRAATRYDEEIQEEIEAKDLLNIHYPYYSNGGIARSWVHGYTFILNKFSKELNSAIIFSKDTFGIGHEDEITELISILGRLSKNNALLIGEPGVGKSSIAKGLAQRINTGNVPAQMKNRVIIQLDLNALISYASATSKNIEELVQKAIEEISNSKNIILYIDEIQDIVSATSSGSGQSVGGILLQYLLDGSFPVIGTINYSAYKKYFYENESLRQSFESVEVREVIPSSTLKILESKIKPMEQQYGIFITFPALFATIEFAQRYVSNRKLPDSAVGVLESAVSWAESQSKIRLSADDIAESVALQTNIPVAKITADEATKLLSLEEEIQSKVIGQQNAVHAVVEAIKRSRTNIRDTKKPIGVFLFMGPTGTGKTHLSKALHQEFFSSESDMIRIDMSEFQEVSSIEKILGTTSGGSGSLTLLDKVKANPFSVVLFDEIEKANPQILDLFLQLFDEGRLTSNSGESVSFNNCIMICTSNIGSKQIMEALESGTAMWEEARQTALLELRGQMRPELLNRFDEIIIFTPHDINNLIKITQLLLNELAQRVGEQGITLEWGDSIPMLIADKANEPGMGARPIKRFIQSRIESSIADEILRNSTQSGDTIVIKESWLA